MCTIWHYYCRADIPPPSWPGDDTKQDCHNASQSTRWIPLWSNKNYYITSIVPPPQYKFFKIHVSKMITRSCAYLQWDFFSKPCRGTCSVERAFPCPWNRAPDSVCLASKPFYILPYALQEELAGISQKGFTLANDLRLAFTTSFLNAVSRAQIPGLDKGIVSVWLGRAQVTVNIFFRNTQ